MSFLSFHVRVMTIAAASLILLSGCGTDRVSVRSDDNHVAVRDRATGAALAVGEQVTIPADFPVDIHRYPGATTELVTSSSEEHTHALSQVTSDDVTTAKASVERSMVASGFQRTSEFGDPSATILIYEKGMVRFQINIAHDARKNNTNLLIVRTETPPATP